MIPAHPMLSERFERIQAAYAAQRPGWNLALTCTSRTLAEQQAAFKSRKSSLDGVRRWSLHQYRVYPMALDVAVVMPNNKFSWDFDDYRLYGELAEADGLTWGGSWERLRDGPHIELQPRDRVRALQMALKDKGYDPGTVDGLDGPKTQAALRAAEADLRRSLPSLPTTIRPHWPHPDLWLWLHRYGEAMIGQSTGLRVSA